MFPGSAGEERTQVSKERTGSSAACSSPPCPGPAGQTPGLGKEAELAPAEGKISLQSKALLCCKLPNENFKTCQSKPKARGCPAQGGSGGGTGAVLAMPRTPVPPPGPTCHLGTAAEWDLFIAHPAPVKLSL